MMRGKVMCQKEKVEDGSAAKFLEIHWNKRRHFKCYCLPYLADTSPFRVALSREELVRKMQDRSACVLLERPITDVRYSDDENSTRPPIRPRLTLLRVQLCTASGRRMAIHSSWYLVPDETFWYVFFASWLRADLNGRMRQRRGSPTCFLLVSLLRLDIILFLSFFRRVSPPCGPGVSLCVLLPPAWCIHTRTERTADVTDDLVQRWLCVARQRGGRRNEHGWTSTRAPEERGKKKGRAEKKSRKKRRRKPSLGDEGATYGANKKILEIKLNIINKTKNVKTVHQRRRVVWNKRGGSRRLYSNTRQWIFYNIVIKIERTFFCQRKPVAPRKDWKRILHWWSATERRSAGGGEESVLQFPSQLVRKTFSMARKAEWRQATKSDPLRRGG